ncbi:hypothetical protein BKA70DRAFT_1270647 [Coprinopsis sp. MPI-PUGE-AT-0042]|nr:hypothetical protein BKA70DRAFT_1270647 [Coprinopsis sp. MPI-PUGE-AT-0042]
MDTMTAVVISAVVVVVGINLMQGMSRRKKRAEVRVDEAGRDTGTMMKGVETRPRGTPLVTIPRRPWSLVLDTSHLQPGEKAIFCSLHLR